MKNKFKLLAVCLLALGMVGATAACDQAQGFPGFGTQTAVNKYTVKFVDDDETVISEAEYEEGAEIALPAEPTKEADANYTYAFAGWDSEVSATATAYVTYKATYTKTAIEYTVTFMADDVQVGEVLTYSADNKNIAVPSVPVKAHYEGVWESYTLDNGNKVVNAVYTEKEYTVTFIVNDTVVYEEYTYKMSTKDSIVTPDIPDGAPNGYFFAWEEYTLENGGNIVVKLQKQAKTFEVTLDANGGTCEQAKINVTFGAAYELPTPTAPTALHTFLGWVDNSGVYVQDGNWAIANDVTLKAVYQFNDITFEDGVVPSYFTAADTTASLDIVEKDGSKVLQLTNSNTSPAMKVTLEFLKAFFDNENVDYIAFDAKADMNNNNFRRDTNRDGALTAVTYEHDMSYTHPVDGKSYPTTGIRADSWKTFYFSRADYNFWVSQGVSSAKFIASGGFSAGKNIYIDNIRSVTAAERAVSSYSFESIGIRVNDTNGKTLLFYTLDNGTNWMFNMQVGNGGFTDMGLTDENVTDGRAALKFTKEAGTLSINFPSDKKGYSEIVTKTGYWAVDIYIPENSDAKMNYHTTTYSGVTLKKGAWTTIYVNGSKNQVIITDTTGGTYKIDNIRSITEAEYNLGGLSFEANASGLRNHELDKINYEEDGTTFKSNAGVAYYYGGADYTANRFSFAFGEGNAEGDINALSNIRLTSDKAYDGTYSLAFDKGAGYMYMTMRDDSTAYSVLKDGFTFWIYSTVEIDGTGTNFLNGTNGKFNGGAGMIIPANTWTKVTVTKEDMNPTRFLILQGSWAGTIYLDGFAPLA